MSAGTIVVAIAIALVAVEAIAWVAVRALKAVGRPIPDRESFFREQSRMLDLLLHGTGRREMVHPTLGWAHRPGWSIEEDRINLHGIRSRREYDESPPPGVRRIAAFGDSYVYCGEVGVDDAWPTQIENGWAAEVLNYGVGAYGLDQAFIRYQEEGRRLAPDTVILGFTRMIAPRMVGRYRRFQDPRDGPWFKPRFFLENGALRLLPPPVASREGVAQLLANPSRVAEFGQGDDWYLRGMFESPLFRWSHAYRLVYYLAMRERRRRDPHRAIFIGGQLNPESEAFALLVRVIEEFARQVRSSGAKPVLLLLPSESDVEQFRKVGNASYDMLRVRVQDTGVEIVDAAPALASSPLPTAQLFAPGGHCSTAGNAVVASAVAAALQLCAAPDRPQAPLQQPTAT